MKAGLLTGPPGGVSSSASRRRGCGGSWSGGGSRVGGRPWLPRLAVVALLAGCAPSAPTPPSSLTPELVWPPPPASPRVRFVRAIAGPRDLGLTPPWWSRALRAITGPVPEGMVRPTAVAVAGARLAVADPGLPAVHLFGADRYRILTDTDAGPLVSPVGVALTADGELFVAESARRRIVRYDAVGRPAGAIADPELVRPAGLAWDERAARLYVTDALAHRVVVYDRSGAHVATFGHRGSGPGELNYPGFIALAPDEVLLSDVLNFRVATFAAESGAFTRSFGQAGDGSGDFARPKGIAVDSHGHVYVADALFDAIQVFDRDGHLLLAFGERGTGPGQFWMPAGLCIDGADRLYVADAYNRRIQIFQYVGGPD